MLLSVCLLDAKQHEQQKVQVLQKSSELRLNTRPLQSIFPRRIHDRDTAKGRLLLAQTAPESFLAAGRKYRRPNARNSEYLDSSSSHQTVGWQSCAAIRGSFLMIRARCDRRFLHTLYEVRPRQNQCITVTRRRCYRLLKAGAPLQEHNAKGICAWVCFCQTHATLRISIVE